MGLWRYVFFLPSYLYRVFSLFFFLTIYLLSLGVPAWLGFKEGVAFRAYNKVWMSYMEGWFRKVVDLLMPYFPKNGGPIVLVQVKCTSRNPPQSRSTSTTTTYYGIRWRTNWMPIQKMGRSTSNGVVIWQTMQLRIPPWRLSCATGTQAHPPRSHSLTTSHL